MLSRCGVNGEIAEKVLGHAAIGVKGVYDRHAYFDEKADALQRLATLLDSIIHPRSDTIVPMRKPKARR